MKMDGTNATMPDGTNFNTHDKSALAEHREGEFPGPSTYSREARGSDQIGLSAALREDIQEDSSQPYERSNGSSNANGVGKFGMKIKKLPRLPFSGSDKKGTKES